MCHAGACARLLSTAPVTTDDRVLWLALFALLRTLLATGAASAEALLSLASSFTAAATPCLASAAAATAPARSLPLSLAGAADSFTAAMFAAAEECLECAQLSQVLTTSVTLPLFMCVGGCLLMHVLSLSIRKAAEHMPCCAVPIGIPRAAPCSSARAWPGLPV
jgi:hypothetical protein